MADCQPNSYPVTIRVTTWRRLAGTRRLTAGEAHLVFSADERHWGIDEYDVARKGLVSHHFLERDGVIECLSVPFRYVWPSELDLMSQLAGLRLRNRWSGWGRQPFTPESTRQVSVWQRPVD